MEEPQTQGGRPWSFETNWAISRGSLETSVTVESSDHPVESDNTTTPKPPLLLQLSSSSESGPCEIKISFAQKHEIRQVYVRSTARVYEIHYASSAQSDDEYLCTVRCSIADREDDLLHTSDSEGASTGEPADVNMVGGRNICTREDDWVEVKIPTATRSFRDFYEATAEISDVDPCRSITLRLLSLQSKGCVYVDEVYVFADAVESADSEHQAVKVENSAGTNLMAMLVPTLLQLSKSRVGGSEDKRGSSSKEKQEYLEIESGTLRSTNTAGGIQQAEQSNIAGLQHVGLHDSQVERNVKLQETYGATLELNHFQVPAEAPKSERSDTVSKKDHSYIQVERVLDQLVSRMSRIEDICLRFEENMLKPINSMLERLERVEQQVEVLAKNTPCPRSSGTIFSAPAISTESNSSSFSNEGNSSQSCGPSGIETKNITTTSDIHTQPDDTSAPVCIPRFLPSLVVTAPEFPCCDYEEENDTSEQPKELPRGKPKKTLSIDDALAAALAGFSSTTTVQSPLAVTTPTPKFAIKENGGAVPLECMEPPVVLLSSGVNDNDELVVPEFTGEEKGNEEEVSEPSHQKGNSLGPSGSCGSEEIMCENHSLSSSTHAAATESASQRISNPINVHVEGTSEVVDCPSAEDGDYRLTEGTCELEKRNLTSKISASDSTDLLKQLHGYRTGNNSSDVTHTSYQTYDGSYSALFSGNASIRDTENVFDKEISSDLPRSSYPSIVDFETPILEVKFASQDMFSANSTLEALLTDVAENSVKAPLQEGEGNLISRDMNLDSLENREAVSSPHENRPLVELDGYGGIEEVSIDMAGDVTQDHLPCIDEETFVSLI